MTILDEVQIGNSVKVNLQLSKDRLNKEVIDIINESPLAVIKDFRITDGKGIGVILELANGTEQWFFENEIDIIDENGNVKEKDFKTTENKIFQFEFFKNLQYENKISIYELINPLNFFGWLIVSFKDIF